VRGGTSEFETVVSFTQEASDCPAPMPWGSQNVTGRLTQTGLDVEGGPILSGSVRRAGDRISGSYTNHLPTDPNQTYTTTWDLHCQLGCVR
jgi:hypothetical protein